MERILIVDDEQGIIDLLQMYFKTEGFVTSSALTATEALTKMQDYLYNIVLCDIRLPDLDGKDLVLKLKECNPLCNIVMMTGFTSMDNVVISISNGAIDYFTKPFRDINQLIDTVKEIDRKIIRWKKSIPMIVR